MEILDLEEGIQIVIQEVLRSDQLQFLVGVYGGSDNGKSYFIHRVAQELANSEIEVHGSEGSPCKEGFDMIKSHQEYDLGRQLYLFHCSWDKDRDLFPESDPSVLCPLIMGRPLDLTVGVYNPHIRMLKGEYDLLLRNPDSSHKFAPNK